MEQTLTFHLEEFDGPLDLLLHLVSKNKMDLYNIEITTLIDQYTQIIRDVQQNRMDLASEFIEMAARLVQMKSYLLLPKSEEAERMKQELTGELIEYSQCKQVAQQLKQREQDISCTLRSPMQMEQDMTYTLHHPAYLLRDALRSAMGKKISRKPPTQQQFEPIVTAPFVSVGSRVVFVLRSLVSGKFSRLKQLFLKSNSKSQTVATFLAVLELVRAGRMTIDDDEHLALTNRKTKQPQSGSSE